MEQNAVKHTSLSHYMRSLHRDIGFAMLGLTLVYALSGVILVYRETDFLKSPETVSATLPPRMSPEAVSQKLHLRRPEFTQSGENVLLFQDGASLRDGSYDRETGTVSYVVNKFPAVIERLIGLHKLGTSKALHVVSVAYGVLLLFLAVSSFWMFKPGTGNFRRGLLLSGAGMALAVFLVVAI